MAIERSFADVINAGRNSFISQRSVFFFMVYHSMIPSIVFSLLHTAILSSFFMFLPFLPVFLSFLSFLAQEIKGTVSVSSDHRRNSKGRSGINNLSVVIVVIIFFFIVIIIIVVVVFFAVVKR